MSDRPMDPVDPERLEEAEEDLRADVAGLAATGPRPSLGARIMDSDVA